MTRRDFDTISYVFDSAFNQLRAKVIGWFRCRDDHEKKMEIVMLHRHSTTVQFPWIVCRYLPKHDSFVERYSFKTEAEALTRYMQMVQNCETPRRKRR